MDNIDFSGVFDAAGGETQEVAAPDTSDETPEVVAPEENNEETAEEEAEGERTEENEDSQSAEEDARFASVRRRYEKERSKAVDRARKEAKKEAKTELDDKIASIGFSDPYHNRRVDSLENLEAYLTARRDEETAAIEKRMEDSGVSREEFKNLLDSHPEVVEARRLKAEAAKAKAEADRQQARVTLEERVKEIGQVYPGVKTVEDLIGHPSFSAVYEKVQKGYSIRDAFILENMDEIKSNAEATAEQQLRNNLAGKAHLGGMPKNAAGEGLRIPDDEMAQFRLMMPTATDEEIRKFYSRDQRRMKRG